MKIYGQSNLAEPVFTKQVPARFYIFQWSIKRKKPKDKKNINLNYFPIRFTKREDRHKKQYRDKSKI